MIIDDLIKNAEEAYHENVKEKHWDWFTQTMLSRLEEVAKSAVPAWMRTWHRYLKRPLSVSARVWGKTPGTCSQMMLILRAAGLD